MEGKLLAAIIIIIILISTVFGYILDKLTINQNDPLSTSFFILDGLGVGLILSSLVFLFASKRKRCQCIEQK
jgi:predicted membrane channel-forming protein YqfA (hemolysin III family)